MSKGEGIVVYCTKGKVLFSSTGALLQGEQSVRKHKVNKSIVHSVFQDLKELETNEYWVNTLTKFSKNIFPKDFKFINNILYYKANTKKHRSECVIDKDDLEGTLKIFKEFMKNKGYISNIEKEEIKQLINSSVEEKTAITNWKEMQKNQNYHIVKFINKQKRINNLDLKESANLESVIRMGIASDFFNENNIVIKDENIEEITSLDWDPEKRLYTIKTDNFKIKKKTDKNTKEKIYTSYTLETSNDNYLLVYNENNDMFIDKKWFKFLETIKLKIAV